MSPIKPMFVTRDEVNKATMRLTGYAEAMRDLRAFIRAGFDLDGALEGMRVHLCQRTDAVKAMTGVLERGEVAS